MRLIDILGLGSLHKTTPGLHVVLVPLLEHFFDERGRVDVFSSFSLVGVALVAPIIGVHGLDEGPQIAVLEVAVG
jgi:hypothetical protein